MSELAPELIEALLGAAREARRHAHAPYSGFPVGAAVVDEEGRIHPGANVENASYPLSACAERSAVQRAVSDGARRLVAVGLVGAEERAATWPCGGCRQVLHEFGVETVVVSGPEGPLVRPLAELLPDAFGPEDLA